MDSFPEVRDAFTKAKVPELRKYLELADGEQEDLSHACLVTKACDNFIDYMKTVIGLKSKLKKFWFVEHF